MSVSRNLNTEADDDIVISGISGKFPESDNIEEFKQQLFDGVNLTTDSSDRWNKDLNYFLFGKVKSLKKFDASFFGVHMKQAEVMDPQGRILLELTYEALIDAGVNPTMIRGSNTGVFIGVTSNENVSLLTRDENSLTGYEMGGNLLTMLANRISYSFDFNGPSYAVDTACSSSLVALEHAVTSIKNGKCDNAIVGGCSLMLTPTSFKVFNKIGVLCNDGKCKSFDDSADGFSRSEAFVVVYLQKSTQAKRIYATVLGANINTDGYKEQGINNPSMKMQSRVIRDTYRELGIDPALVVYVEAHGTGTIVGDPAEVSSIFDVFCKNRKSPLLIGSVKSNMGHGESASGLCGLAKVILSMEAGIIPGNLHFNTPNKNIPELQSGCIEVVSRNTPWNGGIVGINAFGFGGVNAHVVLKSFSKSKKYISNSEALPRIIGVSGRTQEAVDFFLEKVRHYKDDGEFLALLNDLHANNILGHPFRGFILNDTSYKEISEVHSTNRPICFFYSGMGSQWPGMAKDLMKIKDFRESIDRSSNILKQFGIDLVDLLTNSPESAFDSALNCFIAIASIQIALTNMLTFIGIQPDLIIGHSTGETGCAYADGCLTESETILLAYFRGLAVTNAKIPIGAMAAVGLSWEDAHKRCPPDIYPACCNSEDNVTVSGPPNSIEKFVAELNSENIFARIINSAKGAYHSKYVASVVPILEKYLDQLISKPKARSSKWISTSVPENEWKTPLAQMCSSQYQTNNFISPVLFYQASSHIPENAIIIEIAPTDLFKSVLRRTLGPDVTYIALMSKNQSNNIEYLLKNFGKLYNAGAQPQFKKLHDPVDYPVGRGTPMLSPLVKWNHSTEMFVCEYDKIIINNPTLLHVDLKKETFLSGHVVDGRVLYPATGYVIGAWEALAKYRNKWFEEMPVIIQDVKLLRATILPKDGAIKFVVTIFDNGLFEISEDHTTVATGKIFEPENIGEELLDLPKSDIDLNDKYLSLSENDIYKELRIRGYEYEGEFCGIYESNNIGSVGKLKCNKNWISFLDTVLQFSIISYEGVIQDMLLPTGIDKIIINPKKHIEMLNKYSNEGLPIYRYHNLDVLKSGSVEIRGLQVSKASRRPLRLTDPPILETYDFIPYENDTLSTDERALTALSQIVNENCSYDYRLFIAELQIDHEKHKVIYEVKKILDREPQLLVQASIITFNSVSKVSTHRQIDDTANHLDIKRHLIIMDSSVSKDSKIFTHTAFTLFEGGFFLLDEKDKNVNISNLKFDNFGIVSYQRTENNCYILLRKPVSISLNPAIIKVSHDEYSWLEPLKTAIKENEQKGNNIYIYSQSDKISGILGIVNCLKLEPGGNCLRSFFIQDKNVEGFSTQSDIYKAHVKKDLVQNVFKNGIWGSFRHFLLDSKEKKIVNCASININTLGDLSSFCWVERPLPIEVLKPLKREVCFVYYSALNLKNVLIALGLLIEEGTKASLGLEFSGVSQTGKRLMGMAPYSLATHVLADPTLTWEVPANWSLEDASTIPVVYSTVYYSLIIRGRIKRGESILIHAGAGGVGIAAINVALSMGCTVFTTVSSEIKRNFIKDTYPQIREDHIGYSRDNSFEQMIKNKTNGCGVDIVLNSLAGEKLQASIRCLGREGRFIELGKIDLNNNSNLGMSMFLKNTSFHGIQLDAAIESDQKRFISQLVKEGIANGIVKPLPTSVFDSSENGIEKAFRYLASGKHIGKVIVKMRDEKQSICQPTVPAIPRTYMNSNKSYIVIGGLGGFGLELSKWLVSRGVTKLILSSRSGVKNGYQSLCMRKLTEMGATVLISTADVATNKGAIQILKQATELGNVGGIFNLAAVLCDKFFENQSINTFQTACKPKIDVTKQLDIASRDLAPNLDYFVTFSSLACGRGNIGQSNYAFGNSSMEFICRERKSKGFPGLAIQWGAIGDVGIVIETIGGNDTEVVGTLPQRLSSCLSVLDYLLQQNHAVLSSFILATKIKSSTDEKVDLVNFLYNILGIKDSSTIPSTTTLLELGIDSLLIAEAKQYLQRNHNMHLSSQEIRALTIDNVLKLQDSIKNGKENISKNPQTMTMESSELNAYQPSI